jgi:endoglucanase
MSDRVPSLARPLLAVLLVAALATLARPLPPAHADGQGILGGLRWYVDPHSNAKRQADAWRRARPADAAALDRIASQPEADWFRIWTRHLTRAVARRVGAMTAAHALPVLVAYGLPQPPCGGAETGRSARSYRAWIRRFAAGIGKRRAIVVLEPDALPAIDCLSAAGKSVRLALLRFAVTTLGERARVRTYIDAGHSRWHSAEVAASRLRSAGIARAAGFALNVANYVSTPEERAYGDHVSALVGGKHFIVDTSRNGLGPPADGEWCNAPRRALGDRPTTATGDPLADAWLWIKPPGESDGSCNGGPPAGHWWADYALGLAMRAL